MRFAARFIATMGFAFVMVPALYAGNAAKPKAKVKKDEPTASLIAPTVAAEVQPNTVRALPARFSKKRSPQSRNSPQPAGKGLRWGTSDVYTPRVEWFLGYSFWRAMPTSRNYRLGYMHGGSSSVALNFNRSLGLVVDFGGFANNKLTFFGPAVDRTVDSNGSAYMYSAGPRFSYRRYEGITPFFQVLFGGTHMSSVMISGCAGDPSCTPLDSENAFLTMLGAGFDIKISHRLAIRPIQGDYLLTNRFSKDGPGSGWQKSVRLSSGIVLRFGGNPPAPPPPPPNRSPVVSCSVDPRMVYAGSGDMAVLHAVASDPDNDPITYSWVTNGGAVDGTGPEARWNSAGAAPGTYGVNVRVDDGRGGTADCSSDIRVELRPNRPPTISCSADRNSVLIGQPVQIIAKASDPDNDPLTYSWKSSGGQIRGTGPSTSFETTSLKAGDYSVTGHVDDSHGGTADCQLAIRVQEPPHPPEMVELERRLALHSIYFQTARPTEENPRGGLVPSQERILAKLAADFSRYLVYKPDAHLILGGHADQRGSKEYNKSLTDRRVDRAKSYLVEHGVLASALETRSYGFEDNLNADQVKEQIAQNPELTASDRQQILRNLPVMVLANNRRVDVALSNTGQQSVKQYPFNARDYLALIDTKGVGKKSTARPARKRTARKLPAK